MHAETAATLAERASRAISRVPNALFDFVLFAVGFFLVRWLVPSYILQRPRCVKVGVIQSVCFSLLLVVASGIKEWHASLVAAHRDADVVDDAAEGRASPYALLAGPKQTSS